MMGCKLAFIFTAITLGTSFQFGYHTGVINQPLNLISDFIRDVTISRGGSQDDAYTTTMVSICVTTWLVGGMIGGIFGGFIANKFGRKRSIIYLSFPCLLGCLLMMTCKVAGSFEMLIVGRLFVGLACGAYTAVGPMYLAELAHPSSRGAAGVLNQLVTAGSLLFSQVLAMPIVMSTEQLWPILLGLSCIPCVISVVCLLFCPESPRYLFLIKNDPVSAQEVLLRLRGPSSDVQAELDGMSRESEAVTRKARVLDLWHVPHLRLALVIAIVAQMGQQLSGINGIFYYSVKLFESNGLSPDQANYASIGTGGALFLITLVSIFIIDRTGRRVLLIGGLIVAFFCLIIFTGCMIGKTLGEVQWPAYVAIVVIYVFVCGFGIGAGSIPWFIVAELFPQDTRDAATSVAVLTNWLCNIVVGLGFIQLIKYIGIYSFVPFIIILVFVIGFLIVYLPETKGRTPTSIEAELKQILQRRGCRRRTPSFTEFPTTVSEVDATAEDSLKPAMA